MDSGLKYKHIASQLGITSYGLQLKIDYTNEFKASEILKLCGVLSLSNAEKDEIFFTPKVDYNSTNGLIQSHTTTEPQT